MSTIIPAQREIVRALVDNRITTPGLYLEVPERIYHADPCPSPSLSASVANVLIDQSPSMFWRARIGRQSWPLQHETPLLFVHRL